MELAHTGHQGIVKTKRLLREKVWFPGIDRMVKERIDNCIPCQAATPGTSPRLEPLRMTPLPSAPWKELAADFLGPFPSGDHLLVVIDEHSRFPEVEITTSTSARSTIPKLDAIFARQGIPDVLKSDNGPPFNGQEIKNFAEHLGFQHRKVTPLWPRANGEAERFMRTLDKFIRAAHVDNKNWKQELFKFQRQYRATPHSTTNLSPSEALNHRKLKTTLPEVTPTPVRQQNPHEEQRNLAERDADQKMKMKTYADQKLGVRHRDIKLGDIVLVKQAKSNKLSTPFNPQPFVVEKTTGTMVTAGDGDKTVTRNASMFKVIATNNSNLEERPEQIDMEGIPTSTAQEKPSPSYPRRSMRQRRPPARLSDYVQ